MQYDNLSTNVRTFDTLRQGQERLREESEFLYWESSDVAVLSIVGDGVETVFEGSHIVRVYL